MQRHIPVAEDWCQLHNLGQMPVHTVRGAGPKPRMVDCAGLDRSKAVMFHSIAVDHVDGLLHTMTVLGLAKDRAYALSWNAY